MNLIHAHIYWRQRSKDDESGNDRVQFINLDVCQAPSCNDKKTRETQ